MNLMRVGLDEALACASVRAGVMSRKLDNRATAASRALMRREMLDVLFTVFSFD
jgi:hypothetical protein